MRKCKWLACGPFVVALLAAMGAGCSQDEVKMIDVPRKDIPPEVLNAPIPPEAFKTVRPAARKQMEKMQDAVKKATSATPGADERAKSGS